MGAGAAGSLTGAAELFRFWVFPDCTFLDISKIKEKYQKQVMIAIYRYEKINYELNHLRSALNEAQIPFIPLKGSVFVSVLPRAVDADEFILVHESDLERDITALVD